MIYSTIVRVRWCTWWINHYIHLDWWQTSAPDIWPDHWNKGALACSRSKMNYLCSSEKWRVRGTLEMFRNVLINLLAIPLQSVRRRFYETFRRSRGSFTIHVKEKPEQEECGYAKPENRGEISYSISHSCSGTVDRPFSSLHPPYLLFLISN